MELIGNTTVTRSNGITLVKEVKDILQVEIGDVIGFYKTDEGLIFIKKVKVTMIPEG